MKEQYIRQVKKHLSLPAKYRADIVRDLEEIFASALENGETEQQVIERLGTPSEFAASAGEQFKSGHSGWCKRRKVAGILIPLIISAVSLCIFASVRSQQLPDNVIGYADGMTDIKVGSSFAFDVPQLLLIVGIAALVVLVVQIVRAVKK